ncbi:bacteriohemerythrin [Thermodesulfobacteriota bacterium]
MALIDWSEALSVGFEEVDDDHKKLVDMINNIHNAVSQIRDKDKLADTLEDLLGYTSWHFRHEERLMQNYGYPELFNHKLKHEELAQQATELYERFLGGDDGVPAMLLPFLKDWLTDHITGTDKKMGQYLADFAR